MKFTIAHLTKRFEKKEVLRDIDFTFEEGKIYGLLGRNGAGKTTLFNCLNRDIQADGGTRCASITGGFVALWIACQKLVDDGVIEKMPLTAQVVAVSVGIYEDEPILDLNYAEDSHAIVDCNVAMTSKGAFIEVQGTGEGRPFTEDEFAKLLDLGKRGCERLCQAQSEVMGACL